MKSIPDDWGHRFLKCGFCSFTFSPKKYGGPSWRAALCKCWCVRMQHWCRQVLESRQRDDCQYDDLDIVVLAPGVVHDVLNLPDGHVTNVTEIVVMVSTHFLRSHSKTTIAD